MGVAHEEVCAVVLCFLDRHYPKAALVFKKEAHRSLKSVNTSGRRVKQLGAVLQEYVELKEKDALLQDMMRLYRGKEHMYMSEAITKIHSLLLMTMSAVTANAPSNECTIVDPPLPPDLRERIPSQHPALSSSASSLDHHIAKPSAISSTDSTTSTSHETVLQSEPLRRIQEFVPQPHEQIDETQLESSGSEIIRQAPDRRKPQCPKKVTKSTLMDTVKDTINATYAKVTEEEQVDMDADFERTADDILASLPSSYLSILESGDAAQLHLQELNSVGSKRTVSESSVLQETSGDDLDHVHANKRRL